MSPQAGAEPSLDFRIFEQPHFRFLDPRAIFGRRRKFLRRAARCLAAGLAARGCRVPAAGEKLLDPADDRLGDLPVDGLWNPPSPALSFRRRIDLIFPLFEKLAAEIQQTVEQALVKAVRRQHGDRPPEQRSELDFRRAADRAPRRQIREYRDRRRRRADTAARARGAGRPRRHLPATTAIRRRAAPGRSSAASP